MEEKIVCDSVEKGNCRMEKGKIDYSQLYFPKRIVLKKTGMKNEFGRESEEDFTVEIRGLFDSKPDCKVGSFTKNFWFRTPAGKKCMEYKSAENLMRSVEKVARNNGFEVVKWVDRD